jgi:DNA-binding winged helix-turn-helix (wHTH) protein
MERLLPTPGLIRCGAFEIDLKAFELRKHGLRLKLAEQPFQILALLLEKPGEIVTRDELQARLWPGDTFVDFDHGLNNAVLRRAATGSTAPA